MHKRASLNELKAFLGRFCCPTISSSLFHSSNWECKISVSISLIITFFAVQFLFNSRRTYDGGNVWFLMLPANSHISPKGFQPYSLHFHTWPSIPETFLMKSYALNIAIRNAKVCQLMMALSNSIIDQLK